MEVYVLAVVVIIVALIFDGVNGFHDAANAIATAITTGALKARTAIIMAAGMNLIGALMGTAVAAVIARDIVDMTQVSAEQQLFLVIAALLGAIGWNLITWWFGLPSSSTHAIIGGLMGAGLAEQIAGNDVHIKLAKVVEKVIDPMVLSPVVGFGLALIIMVILNKIIKKANLKETDKFFRSAQIFTSASLALGHGLQDAQKSMGLMFMAAAPVGFFGIKPGQTEIPLQIILMASLAISAGTMAGGQRIIHTLGSKITVLSPQKGFVAEAVSSAVLFISAYFVHAPISTTHTVTSAIAGTGASDDIRAVKWSTLKNIVMAWIITVPSAGLIGFMFEEIFRMLFM
ncbi:inorganic phosphate transporter [Weissella cibaria]|jgi:PiT family inorganic phosphate transporter|uniref:Inorganic phosphate transporter n=4 Tax=Weissella TaxID=46255 RepID=A0A1X4JM41_9LACO|nr:inorganic phosphate transporter [Weissella cibaria]APS27593.1 Low-affinity inorganic phosphate transporter 1 [Weissella cibaria]APU62991.1 Low-affinity inorganic phosphate transporter 1 [Weissella cibaria]APU65142.1 Low-affinity inorganic phosphate transporter 1 [Weissella cibaria]ASS51481.1 Low-affinity inorganic phosphate transporter 1 [Weissella cibaria]AVO65921.1 inorganic phosphate transporter [Weissella cibaria]